MCSFSSPLKPPNKISFESSPKSSKYVQSTSSTTSTPARYHEIATSDQPYPMARLLDRIVKLQQDLKQQQLQHQNEREQMKKKYNEDLHCLRNLNDNLERKTNQMRKDYQADFDRVLEKVRDLAGTWTTLEAKTCTMKAEIDDLRADERNCSITADASVQTDTDHTPPMATLEVRSVFNADLKLDETSNSVSESQVWKEKKISLGKRQSQLEETILALQNEAKSSNTFTKELQRRLGEIRGTERFRDFELAHLQARNTAYSRLFEEMSRANNALEAHVQCQAQLLSEANDSSRFGDYLDEDPSGAMTGRQPASNTGQSTPTAGSAHVENQNQHAQSAGIPDASAGRKRTWSELMDYHQETNPTDPQRRRTGSQSYVAVPSKKEPLPLINGKPHQWRDLSSNWRRQAPAFGQPSLQHRATSSLSAIDEARKDDTTHDRNSSTFRAAPDIPPSQSQAPISLPSSPRKGAEKLPENVRFASAPPSRLGGSKRKWQKSVLRKA